MFSDSKEIKTLRQLKELRLKIDLYQMEIISMNYPDGNKELEKEIKQMLIAKMKEALESYKQITNQL